MDAAFRKLQAEKAAERGETAPKEEPREPRQAPEPRKDKPLMRKGRSQGWVVAPQIGDQHQAEIPDAPTRRARGPRRGRDAKASNVSDGKLAWQAGNWKPHPDGNKGGPCGDLILAARHALDEGHPEGWPPRRRDDVHEAIEQREPFSWLGVDGQPVPLESDEQVLALIQAHGGNARRAAYAMTSGLGAAAEAGARKRFDQQRKLVLRAAAQGATPSCVGSRPLAAQLFDPARPPTRETRLFAALPGFMAGVSTKPRSKRSRRYMVPPDLTKRKSGVAAGQARVEEFKRKEREAKLKADEEARKAAEAQQRAENGNNEEEDKKDSSSDDEQEQEGRRRLERRGRGLGRADAAQRWRDLEQKADQLCQRAQRHQPKAEKEPAKEPPSKKRRKKAQESSDDDDDVVPVAKNDQRPTLAECVAILREAEDLPDCPPSIGGVGEDPVSLLKDRLDEVWRHVARCRLLAARARDCVARGSADEASAAYDARGFGYSVYARTNADGTPKQTANEIVAAGVGVSRSGARGLSTGSNVEEEPEEDVVAGLGAMSEREPTLPLEDAEACLRQLKQHCIRDDDALRPLAACLRAASAWRRKAHDSLEGQGAPARQIAPGQLLGLAQRGRAMPFVEEDLCAQLEERAADARELDRELSRALDGVTTPNLQTLKELRERCRDFVGVKLEARRELDSLCDAAEQWAKDARRILTDPHAKKAPTKARRLLEQLNDIKCGVGPMGVTLQEQVAKADKWTEQALSVYEGGSDDYAALGRLVDAAEDVPAPRRALTACSRRHRFLQWVREARGALVACSVRDPGDHDEVIRPGIQDAKDHLESLDELRKGATDDLAKLARKQNQDPAVILHPEKRGEVEEVDPVQKGEDRRAASNARKEALLEAKRKQEEEKARLAEKKPPPPEDTDSSSEDYSDHEDVNQCQRRKLTALTIRKAARDATHVSEEESQLREILAKAEAWAAKAKSLKPATCAGGLTEIPHEKLMAAPTLAQLKKLVDQGEALAIDCTIQLRPLRTASRQAGAWLHNSRDVRRKLNLEATTDQRLWVTTTNDSDSDDSDAVVKQESGDEDESGVTALQLSSCLAQARRLGAKVDELAQLRQLGSRVDAWRARHRELCPRRSTLIDDQPQKSSTRSKASEKARQLAEEEAARANVREPSKAEKRRPVYLTIGACTGDAKPTPEVLRTLDAALNTLPLDMDVERQALADRLTAASELKSEVRTLLSDVGERCVGLLPNHTARLARLETGDSDSEDSDSEDSDDAPLVPRPAPVAPMDVDSAVDKKPPPKPRPKKLSRQERLDRDELERDALPEDDDRGRGVLRAELVLKREVEGALAKAPRVRTADERRLERCLDILAWCAAARRITAVACAAQAREERAFEAKDRAQKALASLREAEHVTDEMRDGQLRLSREAAELADRADRGEAVDADELSGIDRDRQLLWHGLQARDANDQPEDIRCLVPWEQLHKYWSLRIAALRDKFGQLHGWRDEARKALERRDAPLVSVLEDLLSRGAALQQKMTSRRDRRGIMDACDSLRRRKKWIFDARDALRSGPKRKLKAVDALAREATKVGLGDCEDARALRSAARAARAWFAKVKRTGIERGEASISELRALLPEAAKIRVDISGDVDVVKQASLQVCLCASPADGQMLQCESCAMQFHARCVGRGGPDLEPLVSKKRPQPLNAAAKKKARLLDQDRQAAAKAAQDAMDALNPPAIDEDPETRYKSVSNVSTEPFTCARCVLERFAASEREATERTLENNIGAWVDGVRNIVARPTGDTLALAAVRCVSKAPKDPPQLMRSVDALVKQCPPETAQPLRRLAWAYAAAALLRAPPRCRDVIPITSAAPSLGIPDLPLQHFSGCLERGAVLRRRLAQLCRRPEPRSRPKPKPKPTPDEVVEEPPQEEEPPEEAEVKTSSSRGKERKVDVAAVKAVLEASRHIPLRLETLRRRCAAIIDDGGKRYCFCRGPSDGAFMLGCNDGSACGDEWFHGRCVGVEEADEKAADEFVCSKCRAARANEEMPPIREFVAFGDEVSDDEDTPETLAALAKEDRGEAQFSLPWPPALLGASDEFKEAVEKQQAERSAQQSQAPPPVESPPWAATS